MNKSNTLPDEIIHHIQHLERIRQDFVANVSHELRTPLTVIHGYLEILLSEVISETHPWKKIFLQMQQQTYRMEHLIEDLLLLARLENDTEEQAPNEPVDVPHLLRAIQQDAEALSGDLRHQIRLKADTSLGLLGNKNELRNLFSNIIFNAVKYTQENGEIAITWKQEKQKGYFTVRDTGIGVAPKHIPRLTERFYRVDPARARTSGGTGLGLAIAKHVLLRHQGELKIKSKLHQGSLFTCIFPKKRCILMAKTSAENNF